MKIVVTNNQSFTSEQQARLDNLGDATYYDDLPSSAEEYLKRVKGADIICSGTAGLKDAYPSLKDVYVTVGFVSVAFLDLEVLARNNVLVSNAPGINRHAVSEWVFWMMLTMLRQFDTFLNSEEDIRKDGHLPQITIGLAGKNITILGQGNIGNRVGELARAFDMNVSFFKRGDDLIEAVRNADVIVDVLSSNPSTKEILDKKFFQSLKNGSYFVSATRSEIVDEDAMIAAIDDGLLSAAAMDCGGTLVGDTKDPLYRKLKAHPKVYVTPHIAYNSEVSMLMGSDVMIDNVEAYINGRPQNILN